LAEPQERRERALIAPQFFREIFKQFEAPRNLFRRPKPAQSAGRDGSFCQIFFSAK